MPRIEHITFEDVIAFLNRERAQIEEAISQLERLRNSTEPAVSTSVSRKGRKSMTVEERQQVSIRMRAYWAGRRRENVRGAGGNS